MLKIRDCIPIVGLLFADLSTLAAHDAPEGRPRDRTPSADGQHAQSGTVTTLTEGLKSTDLPDRLRAACELLRRGDGAREAFPALLRALVDDPRLDAAIAGQTLYARPGAAGRVPELVSGLRLDTKARVPAAWELSRIGPPADEAASSSLRDALTLPDKHERNFIILALMQVSPPAEDLAPPLIGVLRDRGADAPPQLDDRYPRATAALAMGVIGPPARAAVPILTATVKDREEWEYLRAGACFALGRIGGADARAGLEQAALDPGAAVRTHARHALRMIDEAMDHPQPDRSEVPGLIRALIEGKPRMSMDIVDGLRALGEFAGTVPTVGKKGSGRSAPPVHESISLALGYLDSLATPPRPADIAQADRQGRLAGQSRMYVMALGGVQQGIAPALLESLAQGEQDPRVRAIRRLAEIGREAQLAVPVLREVLDDPDWIVRREAFLALQRIQAGLTR